MTGDMCEDLCVLGLVEYKRCLYYENGKKVIEARWRGNPIILKSKLENFSSYEPLGILDYQVTPSSPVRINQRKLNSVKTDSQQSVVLLDRTRPRSSPHSMWFSTPLWK